MGMMFTEEQLNSFDKDVLISIVKAMSGQIDELNSKMDLLLEQLNISNSQRFGRKSEKDLVLDEQLCMFFNEAEDLAKGKDIAEPELEEVVINMYKRKKTKGKRV